MIKLVQYYFDGYNTDTTFSRWKLRSGDRDGSGYLEANWSLCPPPLRYLIGYVCLSTQYNQRLCWSMMIYDLCHFFFAKGRDVLSRWAPSCSTKKIAGLRPRFASVGPKPFLSGGTRHVATWQFTLGYPKSKPLQQIAIPKMNQLAFVWPSLTT